MPNHSIIAVMKFGNLNLSLTVDEASLRTDVRYSATADDVGNRPCYPILYNLRRYRLGK